MIAVAKKNTKELEEYMRGFKDLHILSRAEEQDLFRRVRSNDKAARDILISHNMKFALKVALHYNTKHLTIVDLLSEASIGLSKAVDEFDPSTGLKFISYAVWWIKAYINRAISDKDNTIRVPMSAFCNLQKTMKQLKSNKKAIRDPLQELPPILQKVVDINNMGYLDGPAPGFDTGSTLKDTLIYEEDVFDGLEPFEIKNAVEDILAVFTEKETKLKNVFIRVFGLKSGTPETLGEISFDMGLTRERVRQIKLLAFDIVSKRYIKDKLGKDVDLEKELKYTR